MLYSCFILNNILCISRAYSSGSPYYVTNQNSVIGGAVGQSHVDSNAGGGGGNGGSTVGALIALKRNHAMASTAPTSAINMGHQQQQQQPQQLQHHPDVLYEEMPTDYSGNMESGDDECDAKRQKYISEVL